MTSSGDIEDLGVRPRLLCPGQRRASEAFRPCTDFDGRSPAT